MVLRIGEDFAGYRIVGELGRGGMGVVYRAVHPRLPLKTVALKVFDAVRGGPRELHLFGREADLVCGLAHPNIVQINNRGDTADGLFWIEMEYVDGANVTELLRREPTGLDPKRAVGLIADAAAGIDHAHHHKVVHRDIKPSNLLVSTVDGVERVVVADFGIARSLDDDATLTGVGQREYSPHYVAPERFLSSLPDHRSDVYSLGATLCQLLTGSVPYPNRGERELIRAHCDEPAPVPSRMRPALPAVFDSVIARAMAKAPAQRYQSCAELVAAARAALSGEEITAPSGAGSPLTGAVEEVENDLSTGAVTVTSPGTAAPARGRPWLLAGVALIAVCCAVAGGWFLLGRAGPAGSGAPADSATPTPGLLLSDRCYWTVRQPIAAGTFVELPSGNAQADAPRCILNLGDETTPVVTLQRAISLCHDIPLQISGRYDYATKSAIRKLQNGAGVPVDGIFGPRTRADVLRWPVLRESDGGFEGVCRGPG